MKKLILIPFFLIASCVAEKDYEVGYVTKGNPDNNYLDTCKTYCCGD